MPLLLQPQIEPLPGYRLIEPLGKGGFGEVWKCEAPGGLFKAVKIVRNKPDALDAEGTDAQLELQALEIVRSVRHPFLLSMDRIEIVEGVLVVVMELADESLHDQLRHYQSVGQAGVPRAALLARLWEAAEVLDVMNLRHRLLHLDVKPHNILLLGGHSKVADFGLVSRLPRAAEAPACRPGVVSPVYASPEAFRGEPSPASDQYSLAVSFHELLTGGLPFRAANVRQMAMQHAHAKPDLTCLPESDRTVVARALDKDPAKRFLSCTQFVAALLAEGDAAKGISGPRAAGLPSAPTELTGAETRSASGVDAATAAADRGTAPPTAVLASCQFEECVARGETTEVWTARTTEGLECFVKFFHGLAEIDADSRRDGIHLLRSVRHPGLVPYNLVRDDGGRLIVVVPRKGPSLRERWSECRADGRRGLPRAELLAVVKNIARTLDALNSRNGVPHLALNPDAVQLVNGQALAADFGLAAWFWLPSGQSLADVNPRYAAPELGANAVSRFCDPYSLALLFQEMLTGVHPLGAGARPTARAYSQPDLSPLEPGDRAVLARALDRTASRRFNSCIELASALEHRAPGSAGPILSAVEIDAAAALILAEVVADAAGGWQLRKHGLFRYMIQPGEALRHDCVARASAEAAPALLADFCRRWQAEVTEGRDDAVIYRIGRTDDPTLRTNDKSGSWETVLRFQSRTDSPLTDVRIEARPVGCGSVRARQLLDETGPLLLDALRGALQAHPDRRRQDRVPFDQPLEVHVAAEGGAPETVIQTRAVNLSRTGIGLLLPVKPASRRVIVLLPSGGDAPPAPVPARLVRVQPRDDGYEAGALFLGGEG
jgi:serine/threonine protein kinase